MSEVLDTKTHAGDIHQHKSGFQHKVRIESQSVPDVVKFVNKAMHLSPRIQLLPLRYCDAQQQVGIRQGSSTPVAPDEDLQHSLNVLRRLFVPSHNLIYPYRSMKAVQRSVRAAELVHLQALIYEPVVHVRPALKV